jgi:hypothetical protein
MKKLSFLVLVMMCFALTHAQQAIDLQENTPVEYNGLVYGYTIVNESSKEVKGEDYERYVVSFFATNKSGSLKLIPFSTLGTDANDDEMEIAEFYCKNATGKRLTSKSGHLKVKPWFTKAKISDGAQPAKYKLVDAQVGFALLNGQTVSEKIVVIVPKGERPQISCRPATFPQ